MRAKKFKWWILLIPVLAVVVILAAVFWNSIIIYLAPKAALTSALSNTLSQLDERFRYNPIRNTINVYDREGQYIAQVELVTANDLLGEISYDMTVQTDASGHQLMAEGTTGFSGRNLELSLYMNGDFMAVSSAELLNGNYYGITYDTFSSDMDSFPLVKYLIPSTTMQEWEATLSDIQAIMSRSYEALEITEEDIRMLVAGVLLLDCKVKREDVQINGQTFSCHKITYSAGGEEVKEVLGYILDTSDAASAEITASFYLYEDVVIALELVGTAGENTVSFVLTLGEKPLTDELVFIGDRMENKEPDDFMLTVDTQVSGNHYVENLDIACTVNGSKHTNSISYDWDSASGDLILNCNNTMPIRLNLTQSENGVQLISDDFAQLTAVLLQSEKMPSATVSGTVTFSKGSAISEPSYKNLDEWSMDDLLTLLGGIGSLIGFDLK